FFLQLDRAHSDPLSFPTRRSSDLTMMLADARDLRKVLQRTVEVVAEVMKTKAASIRLIDQENDELRIRAVYNLSPEYLGKGPIRDRKSTRLNSSHVKISYAVFCLK